MVDSKGPNKCSFFSASGLQDRPQYVTKFCLFRSERARSESPAGDVAANGKGTLHQLIHFVMSWSCCVLKS